MPFRPDILAGRAVIVVSIQDKIDEQLRSIRSRLRRFANFTSELGGDLFRFGAVGTVGSVLPVREFMNFQDQLLFIQTKLQATDAQMVGLEGTIRDLGKSTSFTSTEVGRAAQQLAQAGFTIAEIQNGLQSTLDLARAGQLDLSTASQNIIQVMRAFNFEAKDSSEIASKFITAARLGPLSVVDLGEALKFTTTMASGLNVSLSDTLASITLLSQKGLRGTLAGTSINKALQSLAVNSDKVKELLDVDIDASDFTNLPDLFEKLNEALSQFDPKEQITILSQIASIRGARAIGPLISQTERLRDVTGQISGSLTEARQAALKLDSRLGGVFRRALSAFQELLITIGEASEGPLS